MKAMKVVVTFILSLACLVAPSLAIGVESQAEAEMVFELMLM